MVKFNELKLKQEQDFLGKSFPKNAFVIALQKSTTNKKSRMQETLNLSNNADRSTNTKNSPKGGEGGQDFFNIHIFF